MSRVEEIEQAVEKLTPADFNRLASWFNARQHSMWTRQMERDAADSKLDSLFAEAETERKAGQLPSLRRCAREAKTAKNCARQRVTSGLSSRREKG